MKIFCGMHGRSPCRWLASIAYLESPSSGIDNTNRGLKRGYPYDISRSARDSRRFLRPATWARRKVGLRGLLEFHAPRWRQIVDFVVFQQQP